MNGETRFILAGDLDDAGVPRWYFRLRDARRRDPTGRAYDLEWREIVREYRQRTGPLEVVR